MSESYFDIFELDERYEVDTPALERAYFAQQRLTHPDMLTRLSEAERLQATQRSMDVNAAYHALKDPLLRAEYLLRLKGILVNTEKGGVAPDHSLLMEAMEQREALTESRTRQEVSALMEKGQHSVTESIGGLTALFASEEYAAAAQETIRLRYRMKFIEEAKRLLQHFQKENV